MIPRVLFILLLTSQVAWPDSPTNLVLETQVLLLTREASRGLGVTVCGDPTGFSASIPMANDSASGPHSWLGASGRPHFTELQEKRLQSVLATKIGRLLEPSRHHLEVGKQLRIEVGDFVHTEIDNGEFIPVPINFKMTLDPVELRPERVVLQCNLQTNFAHTTEGVAHIGIDLHSRRIILTPGKRFHLEEVQDFSFARNSARELLGPGLRELLEAFPEADSMRILFRIIESEPIR